MRRQNYKGFTIVEAILLVAIVGILGFVGWRVWDVNKSEEPAQTSEATKQAETEKEGLPEGYAKYSIGDTEISLVYPTSWGNIETNPESKGGGYALNGMEFSIQEDTSVKIGRSFNAPSYCSYNSTSGEWEKGGDYPPSSCEPSVLTVSNVKAYGFSKGALGAYGFNYGINIKGDKYLVIGDSILADGTVEKDPETYPSQSDVDKLKAELDKNIATLLSNNQEIFE